MLGFAEHPWCHPAALRAAGMTALRETCRFWETDRPELPDTCRFAICATRAQAIPQHAVGGSALSAPRRFRCPRTFLAVAQPGDFSREVSPWAAPARSR